MEHLIRFDPQPVGDAEIVLRDYESPYSGERFHNKAHSVGEGYETQFFHIDGDPVDVRKVDGEWYWVMESPEADLARSIDRHH